MQTSAEDPGGYGALVGKRNYLVEGVSGTGKTSVCNELHRRGFSTLNGDRELAYQGDPATGEPVTGITGVAVHEHHLWDAGRVRSIAADETEPVTFFCGGARNVRSLLDVFDRVFVLTVDPDTLERRLDARDGDEWAGVGRLEERALVRRLHATGADTPDGVHIDATQPLGAVVDDLLHRCGLAEH